MYDTLMQMGRWFGYRPRYEDLCRIWLPKEAAAWYAHIGEATEELQQELRRMERAKATPEEFGLAIRSHPSALMVTARNKMGSGEKQVLVGLSNNYIETTKLSVDAVDVNRQARDRFLRSLGECGTEGPQFAEVPGGLLVSDVPVGLVDSFLRDFVNERESILTDTRPVRQYVADRAADELSTWDVLIASRNSGTDDPVELSGWPVRPIMRSIGAGDLSRGVLSISGSRARVASRGMEKAGVDAEAVAAAEEAYVAWKRPEAGEAVNFPDRIYRAERTKPLLLLFNIRINPDVDEDLAGIIPEAPVVGWGISFPTSARPNDRVEYILNTVKLREMFGDDDTDEDLERDED